jgi:ribonuclease III
LKCNGYPPPPLHISHTSGHLALFNQRLQKRNVVWTYKDGSILGSADSSAAASHSLGPPFKSYVPLKKGKTTTPTWIVEVLVDGECYGQGRGGTKKAARNEAAKEGLAKLGIVV